MASYGQSTYESEYNSGIGSNGLTSARHDILSKFYGEKFTESFDNSVSNEVVYIGKHKLTDKITIDNRQLTIGKLLLSPTRTFAPVIKELMENQFDAIHGLIHCSGGGQTKCLKYVPDNVRIIKDNLFEPPIIFQLIQQASKVDDKEMYQVFNMGTRMEIYTNERDADKIISIANSFGVEARVIGRVEESKRKELAIKTKDSTLTY